MSEGADYSDVEARGQLEHTVGFSSNACSHKSSDNCQGPFQEDRTGKLHMVAGALVDTLQILADSRLT